MTIAQLGPLPLTEALVRGRCTDLQVAQHVTIGLTADVEADVRDALAPEAMPTSWSWIDEASDEEQQTALATCRSRSAAAPPRAGGRIDGGWWPRPQERVQVGLGGGDLLLSCTFDLALGGPGTVRPWVLVEVKAGAARDGNRSDLLWYSLVAALRHGRPPDVVAAWSAADDGLVPVPIGTGSLEAAARRALAALDRLVELASAASRRSGRTVAAVGAPSSTAARRAWRRWMRRGPPPTRRTWTTERDGLTDDELGW